jgi:hypothetical protein
LPVNSILPTLYLEPSSTWIAISILCLSLDKSLLTSVSYYEIVLKKLDISLVSFIFIFNQLNFKFLIGSFPGLYFEWPRAILTVKKVKSVNLLILMRTITKHAECLQTFRTLPEVTL